MAIAYTDLNGVEQPRFADFVREQATEKNILVVSGAVKKVSLRDLGLSYVEGKTQATFPFWQVDSSTHTDLTDTNTAVNPVAIEAGSQVAKILTRGRAWGITELAKKIGGGDPLDGLAKLMGEFWSKNYHNAGISILKGLFGDGATGTLEDNYLDSTAGVLTGETFNNGVYKLGDAKERIALHLCHSKVLQKLEDLNEVLITVSAADPTQKVHLFRRSGKPILIDDSIDYGSGLVGSDEAAVYHVGEGAMLLCDDYHDSITRGEIYTTGVKGVWHRKMFMLHPNGVNWEESEVSGITASNANLEEVANWDLTWDRKNVPIVRQDVKLA